MVTCQDERAVLEMDLQSGEAVQRFETRQDGTHVLGFEPGYDPGEANEEAAAFYGVTPFNETLTELLEQIRNQGTVGHD